MLVSTDNIEPTMIVGASAGSYFAYTYNLIDWYRTRVSGATFIGMCKDPVSNEILIHTNDNTVGKPASLVTGPITCLAKNAYKNAGTANTGYYVTSCGKIVYLNGHFVLLDGNGYYTSKATGTWVRVRSVAGANVVAGIYSNGYYIVSVGTAISRTLDEAVEFWGSISPGWSNPTVYALTQNSSGLLVASGASATGTTSGRISTSTDDGATWTLRSSGVSNRVFDVLWVSALSIFVALTQTGEILTSPDGIVWTPRVAAGAILASGSILAYSPYIGKVIAFASAIGAGATIMVSDNAIDWFPINVNLSGWTGNILIRQAIVGR